MPVAERGLPAFPPFLEIDAPQLAIADSSLDSERTLGGGWYLGKQGENFPCQILEVVKRIAIRYGLRRNIYVGGSLGGFASLLLATIDPGSTAIAISPQTNLEGYRDLSVGRLKEKNFPDGLPHYANLVDFSPSIWASSAVIVVSAGDHHHLLDHVIPLVSGISEVKPQSLVLQVDFFGRKGHSASVPQRVRRDWLSAVRSVQEFEAESVLEHFWASGRPRRQLAKADKTQRQGLGGQAPMDRDRHIMSELTRELWTNNRVGGM